MEDADVVVLNTCCIRENADQRLYGTLGRLKELVDAKPGLQIAVGGAWPKRTASGSRRRWAGSTWCSARTTWPARPALLRRAAREGPVMEILDAPDARGRHRARCSAPGAVRELPYAAWVTIQTGCDNSCAFCIVPSVRGPEVSRPARRHRRGGGLLARRGVTEVTLLGQNVNSYGRDITQRRPLFAELLARRRGGRGHRPHPLHQPAPQGPAARDDRGHGRDARGLRAAAPTPPVGQRPGPAGHAPRLHGASGTSSAWRPPAPPSTTWP